MRSPVRYLIVALATVAAGMLLVGQAGATDVWMGGTFTMNHVTGVPGSDLLTIVGNENSWNVLLENIDFECVEESETWTTTLRATSFDFEFIGPDAAILNSEVADQFTQGGLGGNGYFEVTVEDWSPFVTFFFYIWPDVPSEGVYWSVDGWTTDPEVFPLDGNGCPTIGPFELDAVQTILFDRRGSNDGNIVAINAGDIWLQFATPVSEVTWGTVKALYK